MNTRSIKTVTFVRTYGFLFHITPTASRVSRAQVVACDRDIIATVAFAFPCYFFSYSSGLFNDCKLTKTLACKIDFYTHFRLLFY